MSRILTSAITGTAVLFIALGAAQSATYSVLHVFPKKGTDGRIPYGTLVSDRFGTLYGTTNIGGASNAGTVFSLTGDGIETVLYSFTGGSDGAYPTGALMMDDDGNLYGTTYGGGSQSKGVVFKLSSGGIQTVLHDFHDAFDGSHPYFGALLRDKTGNLYGTTSEGGTKGLGIVFKIAPDGTESVLHNFTGGTGDGAYVYSGLVTDKQGKLYGTASEGGAFNAGAVFRIEPQGATSILYSFKGGSDGFNPMSTLLRTKFGTLYGTTLNGGAQDQGTVFELKTNGRKRTLYAFAGGADGAHPYAGVVRDSAGALYGTTWSGGTTNCTADWGCGTVYKLAPDGTETVLHAFSGKTDGLLPYAGLIMDDAGNLYGDTYQCCNRSFGGNVFKLSP